MSGDGPMVFIVDDDQSICEAVTRLLGTVGLRAQAFKTAQDFLEASAPTRRAASCSTYGCPD